MKLYPYQEAAVNSLWEYFAISTGNPIIALPTGSGKSLIIAEFLRRAYSLYADQRVLMLTHVKELIAQNFARLLQLWPTAPAGIYSAGLNRKDLHHSILYCGIASIAKHAATLGKVDLVLVDECHLVSPRSEAQYFTFLETLRAANPHLKVIGLSATPYRLGLGHLMEGGLFTDVCFDLTGREAFNNLVNEGYLAPLVTKRTYQEIDTSEIHLRGGEFVQQELQLVIDKENITEAAVKEILYYGADRKHWLIFAAGVEHAKHVADCLSLNGISAASVHSLLSDEDRDSILRDFKSGKIRAVVNNNILTTGFDFPGIDLIGVLRPTASAVLWIQMLGRGTRPAPEKKDCLVLDFAGNTRRLGPINDPVLPRRKGEKSPGQAPVKVCEACLTYNHASARVCAHCGAEFPRQLNLSTTAYTEEVMAKSEPSIQPFKVDKVTYTKHTKPGRMPSMQVSYYCGLRLFREWVCFEHAGFARKKSHDWWRFRSSLEPPHTIDEAIEMAEALPTPKSIQVWINTKYPEVLGYEFQNFATV